jgi:hypothetical protein
MMARTKFGNQIRVQRDSLSRFASPAAVKRGWDAAIAQSSNSRAAAEAIAFGTDEDARLEERI